MNPQNLLKGMSCKRCSVVKNKKDNFKLPENISLISFSYFEKECFLHCSFCNSNFSYKRSLLYKAQDIECPNCLATKKKIDLVNKFISDTPNITLVKVINEDVDLHCSLHHLDFSVNLKKFSKRRKSAYCPSCVQQENLAGAKSLGKFNVTRALRGDFDNENGVLYLLKIKKDSEEFLKIGVTKNINTRITKIKYSLKPEKIELLECLFCSLKEAVLRESFIKNEYSEFGYFSNYFFGGKTELYSLELIKNGEGLTTLSENYM